MLAASRSPGAFIERRFSMFGERYFPVSDDGRALLPGVAGYLGSSEIIYGELELVLFLIMRGFSD